MKQIALCLTLGISIVLLSGCGSSGAFLTTHVTNVELSEPNFNVIAKDVAGESMQGYLFGISFTNGPTVGTFALFHVSGVDKLYDTAVKQLWANFKANHGDIEGRKLALVNIRHDSEVLNTLVYAQAKYFITADVIEFIEEED
jgi:hypothetical protein